MITHLQIQVSPEIASKNNLLKPLVAKKINVLEKEIKHIEIQKRSIDARQKKIKINLLLNRNKNQ